jgi:hypothetical protein
VVQPMAQRREADDPCQTPIEDHRSALGRANSHLGCRIGWSTLSFRSNADIARACRDQGIMLNTRFAWNSQQLGKRK